MRAHLLGIQTSGWLLSLLACGLTVVPVAAQAVGKDLLETVRRQNEVAAQKMEADVREALAAAQKGDPARAAAQLRTVLDQLEGEGGAALKADRRDTLVRLVKSRLQTVQVDVRKDPALDKGVARRNAEIRSTVEQNRAKEELAQVAALQKSGQLAEALRLAQDLANRYPDILAVKAAAQNLAATQTLASQRVGKPDTEGRMLGQLASVSKSAVPPKGDLEYDVPVWMKALARKSLNETPMTTTEKTILKALSTNIDLDFDGTTFDDVIQYLSDKLKVPLLLDKASLADAQVTPESQVNFKVKGVSARTAIKRLLANFDLTYIIRDETIQVVSLAKARDSVVQRTFYVGHLLAGGPYEDAGIRFVPIFDAAQQAQNAQTLIDTIKQVEPQSWAPNGPGSISYNPQTKSITVRQTAEFQSILGGSLR